MRDFWRTAEELRAAGEPFVVATLVSVRGGAPQEPGAKAIITAEGLRWGTVGGGKVEARAIQHAREKLASAASEPELRVWNLQRDIGMTCGGEATFLFEAFRSDAWEIAVFGAGHVAQALLRALEPLGCKLACIDSRPEWLEKLPPGDRVARILSSEPAREVPELGSRTFFVVMTQGHATDVPILEAIFKTWPEAPYVGVMGSDVKAIRMRKDLRDRGISEALLERLHCPIGLPFGSNEPVEIAVSVAAQLLQERDRSKS